MLCRINFTICAVSAGNYWKKNQIFFIIFREIFISAITLVLSGRKISWVIFTDRLKMRY